MALANEKFYNNKGHRGPRIEPSVRVFVLPKCDLDNPGKFLLELSNSEELPAEKRTPSKNYVNKHLFIRLDRREVVHLTKQLIELFESD